MVTGRDSPLEEKLLEPMSSLPFSIMQLLHTQKAVPILMLTLPITCTRGRGKKWRNSHLTTHPSPVLSSSPVLMQLCQGALCCVLQLEGGSHTDWPQGTGMSGLFP